MRIKHIIFTLLLALGALFPLLQTQAQVDLGLVINGTDLGTQTGLTQTDPRTLTVRIITVSLGLLGILLTCIILYAGFKWMTAGGNEDDVTEAKKLISSAVIGLLIILSAWSITEFVFQSLYGATTGSKLIY